ncbi:DnaJ domain-containing protein [Methanobrevibacter sp.]|uniref:DnaJ domain-containing protein n=1 Tax=Methanobrevibacter sp. TaxID=66852 RepID=UPI00386F8EED
MAGFVAKAQGTISKKQIQEVTKALNELELSYQERKYYQDKFNFGKSLDFAPSESCQKLASLLDGMHPKKKRAFISFSLDLLLPVIFADGVISDEERKRLLMITRALALGVIDTNNLINEYINRYSKSQKEEETKRNNSSDHTKNTNYSSSSHTTGSKEQTDRTQTHSESDNNSSDYTKNTNYSSSSHTNGSKEQTDRTQTHSESDNNSVFAELFALAGFVAKAQGTISKKQIQEVIKALNKLGLSSQERKYYQDKFNFGKSLHFAPSESCQKLASMVDGMNSEEKKAFILFSLDLLLPVIFADGEISNEERKRLLMITRALDINDVLINDLVNEYINRYSEYDSEPKNEFEKALRILGLSKNSQFEEAKAKYRVLMKKYHPDKVGLLHLTAEQEAQIREEYNKKSKEINEAFDIIRAHFGR